MVLSSPTQATVSRLSDAEWESLAETTPSLDVYYRPQYVRAYEEIGHGEAIALMINVGDIQFLVPLLVRPLSELTFASGVSGYDAITPYGFGGLLLLTERAEVSAKVINDVFAALREWCLSAGVISVLVRLHPLLDQEKWFHTAIPEVTLCPYGPTIAYDLDVPWNSQTGAMKDTNRGRRSALSYARRHLHTKWASEQDDKNSYVPIFRDIYEERMDELRAAEFYHFPPEYYSKLMSGLGNDIDILVAWRGEQAVGSTLVMASREFAHAHLTGSTELGRSYNASTVLMIETTMWARRRGCRWLSVGGGPDHLYQFKRSFGGNAFHYSFVTFIADQGRYQDMMKLRMLTPDLPPPRPNFFPEYRA